MTEVQTITVEETNVPTVVEVQSGAVGPHGPRGIQGQQGIQGIKGDKGDPGGFVASSAIADGTDLNTVVTAGMYFRASATGATTALNYPVAGWAGWIEVLTGTGAGTVIMQRATSTSSSPNGTVAFEGNTWFRTRYAGVWQPWFRVDTRPHEAAADPHTQYALKSDVYRTGTGFPTIAAPVGTRYIDSAATNGAVEWIKAAGTGTSGWKVVYGDTGWRDLSQYLVNGAAKGGAAAPAGGGEAIRIRRSGDTVTFVASFALPAWVSGQSALDFPIAGFSHPTTYMPDGYGGAAPVIITTSGSVRIYIGSASVGQRYMWTWLTSDAWPTTLPGV